MMRIEKAAISRYPAVRSFYHSLIDGIAGLPYSAGWKKDIYPAPDYLKESIRDGNLYIGLEDDAIIAAMVVNHQCNDGYRQFRWPTEAAENEVTVIHALGVHPSRTGKGYGRQMVRFVMELARRNRQKVIRLDVLKGNVPAERLYAGMGFRYLHTLPMYYADTGWTDYELYEYVL
ncbi:MAG: GNAT family N-acetyltransferase [Clostridia bacterium]|nr:GNAT family N-acetyltransferase [Clostridia bacterium]